MDRFIFRFGTILNTKEKIEDDRKNKLGISMKKLAAEQAHLENLLQKKRNIVNEFREKTEKIVTVNELRSISNNLSMIQNIIDKQLNSVEQSKYETENKRKELLEASKEKKIFEKLREKDYEDYKYSQMKKEYILADEIISYKAANK